MNRSDNIRLLQDLQYRRRRMAWRAGGMVAAIALSSCIGAGVAFADDTVVETADQQPQAALVQDAQDASGELAAEAQADSATSGAAPVDTVTDPASSDATASEASDEQKDAAEANLDDAITSNDKASEAGQTALTAASSETSEAASNAKTLAIAATSGASAASDGTLAEDSAVKDANGKTIEAFDLRHATADTESSLTSNWSYTEGASQSTITGGTSYVTSVKLQNPWGSCWAFASTSAVETSLLSELDQVDDGKMNGSVSATVASKWLKADMADDGKLNGSIDYGSVSSRIGMLAECAADISERHLAYFSYYDVTEDSPYPNQAGEGKYFTDGSTEASKIIDDGGMPWLSMMEYSSGVGPVPEYVAPYISDENLYKCAMLKFNKEGSSLEYKTFNSYEAALAYYKANWTDEAIAAFNKENGTSVAKDEGKPEKSSEGTWGLDSSLAYEVVAELKNSNVLDQDLDHHGLSAQEITLMKQELLEGHAISVAFLADQSKPGETLGGNTYMNTATWGQYTYEDKGIDHAVCIVGYDDNYAASNFTHNIYKTDDKGKIVYVDGKPVIDEEKTALTTPAGNGAWIVKNSWGAVNADDPADQDSWGIDGTGYFYLSYYDKTINNMESFEFDVSDEAQERTDYVAYQTNLANVDAYLAKTASSLTKMCNVFDGPEQGEGSVAIRDLGFVTAAAGDSVVLEVYVMDDSADVAKTIKAGNPVATYSSSFVNSGFHRIHLETAIKVSPNQKFAVVQTTKRSDGSYEYTFMKDYSEEYVKAYNKVCSVTGEDPIKTYVTTVVNKGESLLMSNGTWKDLIAVAQAFNAEEAKGEIDDFIEQAEEFEKQAAETTDSKLKAELLRKAAACRNFATSTVYAIDNFCIKVYADDISIDITKALVSVIDDVYDGTTHRARVTVTLDGILLTEGVDYVLAGSFEEIEPGIYDIIVKGIGDFKGELTTTWKIIGNPAYGQAYAPASYDVESASPKTGDSITAVVGMAVAALALGALGSVALLLSRRRRG